MKTTHQFRYTLVFIFILCCIKINAQYNCRHEFEETNSTLPATAVRAAWYSNGDIAVAGYRNVNGVAQMVVDRYNMLSCTLIATYICPDGSNVPDTNLQLFITADDYIFIKYKGSSYYNVIQLDTYLVEQNKLQVNPNGYPDLKIALDSDGNLIFCRKKINSSFLFNIQVQKYDRYDFNNLWWVGTVASTGNSFLSIADMVTDTLGNVFLAGYLHDYALNKPLLFAARIDDGGGFSWLNTYNVGGPVSIQSKLHIDAEQNILLTNKSTKDSVYHLHTYKFSQAGSLLWKKSKNTGTLNSLNSWLGTDSSGNVYEATLKTGFNQYGTTKIYKYDKYGNDLWTKSIPNMSIYEMKIGGGGRIYLAGDKFFTLKPFPAYRPYFIMYDTSGNLLFEEYDHFLVGSNTNNSYEGHYNDVVFDEQADRICTIGERKYEHYFTGTKNYFILNAFNTNIPRISFENVPAGHQLNFYPNPVENTLYFKSEIDSEEAQLEIYDMQGRILLKKELYTDTGMADVSSLTKGIYTAAFIAEGYKVYFKLMKH